MSFPDLPPQRPPSKVTHTVLIAQALKGVAKGSQAHFSKSSSGPKKLNTALPPIPHMVPKSGLWKIESINLPPDWDYDKAFDDPIKPATFFEAKEYLPPNHKNVKISLGVCGPTSGDKALHDLVSTWDLKSQPRELTSAEVKSLRDTICYAADDLLFDLKHISILTFLGVPAVLYEGTYKNSGISTLTFVVDGNGEGHPEFLYFEAPEIVTAQNPHQGNLYARYRPLALEAFKTVRWKPGYAEQFSAAKPKPLEN